MTDRRKLNQPYYTEPVEETQSNISKKDTHKEETGFYQNSEAFPPRGSSINIPEDVLFSRRGKEINSIVDDKIENIGSDLYKDPQDTKE